MSVMPRIDPEGGLLVSAMWDYARTVLLPAQRLKRLGVPVGEPRVGDPPVDVPAPGLGPHFSLARRSPVLLEAPTEHDHLVDEFDRMAEIYDAFVQPFSTPIFDEALAEIAPWITPETRALDAGCGSGRELQRMARRVPRGEVVGVDLAAGMVQAAWRGARAHGLDHCAFFQADVSALAAEFEGQFDLVYNSLAHHHYPDPPAATRAILRCLRPGGLYCVIDPGPAWFNALSAPLARSVDPGWIAFHSPEEFRDLFLDSGFARASWQELLPGFGLAVGQKARA